MGLDVPEPDHPTRETELPGPSAFIAPALLTVDTTPQQAAAYLTPQTLRLRGGTFQTG